MATNLYLPRACNRELHALNRRRHKGATLGRWLRTHRPRIARTGRVLDGRR